MSRLVVILAVVLSGCLHFKQGDFAAISTRALPSKFEIVDSKVEGRSCESASGARFQFAVDDALAKVPRADALVGVSYRFDRLCVVVSGTAVRSIE